jgi:hypothetical protein
LEEEGPGGITSVEPADVGGVIEHVKKGDQAAEGGVTAEDRVAGFARDGVEHVDDVKEDRAWVGDWPAAWRSAMWDSTAPRVVQSPWSKCHETHNPQLAFSKEQVEAFEALEGVVPLECDQDYHLRTYVQEIQAKVNISKEHISKSMHEPSRPAPTRIFASQHLPGQV